MMISRWIEFDEGARREAVKSIREIFFSASARKHFANELEKELFWHKWTSYYFENCSDEISVATIGTQTVGYLMGCQNSAQAETFMRNEVPYFSLFADLFVRFPAHLHINVDENFRGQAIGQKMIDFYCNDLVGADSQGLHIVTSSSASNVPFYRKCGFDFEVQRVWNSTQLLFMGRKLSGGLEKRDPLEL